MFFVSLLSSSGTVCIDTFTPHILNISEFMNLLTTMIAFNISNTKSWCETSMVSVLLSSNKSILFSSKVAVAISAFPSGRF